MIRSLNSRSWERRLAAILLILFSGLAFAQSIQLSPEQQRMLDQLPPDQRAQAMQAIRQLQNQQAAPAQQTINETIEEPDPESSASIDEILLGAELRAQSRSRIVLEFSPVESLTPDELRAIDRDPALARLTGSRVFMLDEAGILSIQGLDAIPLLGLNEADISRRLEADPHLSVFDISARILSQEPVGLEALEPFGYDLFEPRDGSFDAPSSGPVPADYVLGPGDTVRVQLFGNTNGIYEFEVSRDGILNLPELGPITVAGIPFSEFRTDLNERVQEMLIGTQVSVTMGPLRTIRVFVLGDVKQPGSHIVGGLATISGALYRSGGVSDIGTLRDIQLKRNGKVVARLDLYDLLINGDTSNDRRLQPGDVVFVPPVGSTVAVGGAVKRPAIYETRGKTTASDVVDLAGGFTAEAYAAGAQLERIDENRERTVVAIDLTSAGAASLRVQRGDRLLVPEVLPDVENSVVLVGHIDRPGEVQWRPGMRLTDLIGSAAELQPGADTGYVLVRRERQRGKPIEVVSANLGAAFDGEQSENIPLMARDQVYVFSREFGRQRQIGPLLAELGRQATPEAPLRQVQISGNVRAPGTYPLEPGMRVGDLIRAGGNLTERAYVLEAELTRYTINEFEGRQVETLRIDLDAVLRGDPAADIQLMAHDYVFISEVPEWDSTWTVTIEGEVKFPGQFRVARGETLSEVVARAGGLTDDAFPEGSVFLREGLREREQEQIEMLARRLEADLTTLSLQAASTGGTDTLTTGRALLDQLRSTEAVGRLVIDVEHLRAGGDVELRDGDELLVPKRTQVVTVIGETQQSTSHLFQAGLSRDDYISLSGGLTRRADKRLIYVVRANGAVIASSGSRWVGRGNRTDIRPGDTIVVPMDTDKMRPLTFWTNVTQIIYQGAIAVAAIRSFE